MIETDTPTLGRARRRPAVRRAPNSAPYWPRLGSQPTLPDDRDGAAAYHARILAIVAEEGARSAEDPARLSKVDWQNLKRLEARWRRRAAGDDRRWALVGATKGGRLPKALERDARPAAPVDAWAAPLAPGETGATGGRRPAICHCSAPLVGPEREAGICDFCAQKGLAPRG